CSSLFEVMVRTTTIRLASRARRGMYSSKRIPGIAVGTVECGPALHCPGFGSQVSNWLGPPLIQTRMARFWFFRSSAATAGRKRPPSPARTALPRNARRDASRGAAIETSGQELEAAPDANHSLLAERN